MSMLTRAKGRNNNATLVSRKHNVNSPGLDLNVGMSEQRSPGKSPKINKSKKPKIVDNCFKKVLNKEVLREEKSKGRLKDGNTSNLKAKRQASK